MKTRRHLSIVTSAAAALLLVATAAGISVSPSSFAKTVEEIGLRLGMSRATETGAKMEPAPQPTAVVRTSSAFYFLAPIGSGAENPSKFDPSLLNYLSVEICEVSGSGCSTVRTFTGQGDAPETVRITGQHYNVNFNAAAANLSNLATYRVRVGVANLSLGAIDVTPGMRGGLGGTWPIKFVIENDPVIRVRVLRFRGQSASQIVNALKSEFNLCGDAAAGLLTGDLRPFPQAEIDVAINGVCQDVVIPDTTKVADETTRNAMLSYDPSTGRMVFAEITQVLRNLNRGDVFVSEPSDAAPFGYLRKITGISRASGQITLETVQAKLNEAIYSGTLHATGELLPNDGTQPLSSPGFVSPEEEVSANIVIDEGDVFNFHRDIDVTVNFDGSEDGVEGTGTVRVTGFVYFNAGYNVGIGIRPCLAVPPACPDRFEAWAGLEQKSRLRVTGNFNGRIQKEKIIHPIPMKPIWFFIGPVPVVLVPEVNVKLGLDGRAHVDFVFEGEAKSKFKAGAKWLNPDYGGNGWNNISEYLPLDKKIHAANINANMRVEGYAKADAKIKLYGVAGPGIDGSVGIVVDAATGRRPFWFMEGHVNANVFFEIGIAGIIDISRDRTQILDRYIRIAESVNSPPVFSNVTANFNARMNEPVILGPKGSGLDNEGYFDVTDPEGDPFSLTVISSNSQDTISRVNGKYVATFRSPGARKITITARDSENAMSTQDLNVSVINQAPEITFNSFIFTFPAGVQYFLTARAIDPETGPLPCSSIQWHVEAPDVKTVSVDNRSCTVAVVFHQQGTRNITATATDPLGSSFSRTRPVNVTSPPANPAPVIDVDSFLVLASEGPIDSLYCSSGFWCEAPEGAELFNGETGDYHNPLELSLTASDPDGEPVSIVEWRCVTGPGVYTVATNNGNDTYSCSPFNLGGTVAVFAIVTDGTNRILSEVRTFTMRSRLNPN